MVTSRSCELSRASSSVSLQRKVLLKDSSVGSDCNHGAHAEAGLHLSCMRNSARSTTWTPDDSLGCVRQLLPPSGASSPQATPSGQLCSPQARCSLLIQMECCRLALPAPYLRLPPAHCHRRLKGRQRDGIGTVPSHPRRAQAARVCCPLHGP